MNLELIKNVSVIYILKTNKIGIILNDKNIEFNKLIECAKFMIENNLTNNKSLRGVRDGISKAIKNNKIYLINFIK